MARELVQWVKVPIVKLDDLSSILKTHTAKGKSQLPTSCLLSSVRVP